MSVDEVGRRATKRYVPRHCARAATREQAWQASRFYFTTSFLNIKTLCGKPKYGEYSRYAVPPLGESKLHHELSLPFDGKSCRSLQLKTNLSKIKETKADISLFLIGCLVLLEA